MNVFLPWMFHEQNITVFFNAFYRNRNGGKINFWLFEK
ncbi:hypothetical protein B4065_2562 [Caldibacillus thermoamylovorans]|nr:hypothetical protein B4065_2562 [Caldibacillus thermoamylovorans]